MPTIDVRRRANDQKGTVYGRPRNSFLGLVHAKNARTVGLHRADSMPKRCRKGF